MAELTHACSLELASVCLHELQSPQGLQQGHKSVSCGWSVELEKPTVLAGFERKITFSYCVSELNICF